MPTLPNHGFRPKAAANLCTGTGITTSGDSNELLIYNSRNGVLYYDADGTGSGCTSVQITALLGQSMHTNSEFSIV